MWDSGVCWADAYIWVKISVHNIIPNFLFIPVKISNMHCLYLRLNPHGECILSGTCLSVAFWIFFVIPHIYFVPSTRLYIWDMLIYLLSRINLKSSYESSFPSNFYWYSFPHILQNLEFCCPWTIFQVISTTPLNSRTYLLSSDSTCWYCQLTDTLNFGWTGVLSMVNTGLRLGVFYPPQIC